MSSDSATEVISIKKLLFLTSAAAILLTGCSAVSSLPPPSIADSVSCTVSTPSGVYECTAQYVSDGISCVTIDSPENASGLSFRQTDEGLQISRGSLICKSDSITLPKTSVPFRVMSVLSRICSADNTADKTEDGYTFSGSAAGTNYTAHANSSGCIKKIEIIAADPSDSEAQVAVAKHRIS